MFSMNRYWSIRVLVRIMTRGRAPFRRGFLAGFRRPTIKYNAVPSKTAAKTAAATAAHSLVIFFVRKWRQYDDVLPLGLKAKDRLGRKRRAMQADAAQSRQL